MKVYLLCHTAEPERIVAASAKLCYSDSEVEGIYEGLNPDKTRDFVKMLADMGHESPTEHANFTFGIEGVSRSLLAQITRHRLASYSVQSQRYVKLDDFRYVTPPAIAENPKAKALYEEAMERDKAAYEAITEALFEGYYKENIESGMAEKPAKTAAQKKAIEDARFVLPNACETKMVVTMNARSLNNFFRHRCCNRAQWEIRALADEMLKLCLKAAPSLFSSSGPPCVSGACPEGKMSCGRASEMRERYKRLREGAAR